MGGKKKRNKTMQNITENTEVENVNEQSTENHDVISGSQQENQEDTEILDKKVNKRPHADDGSDSDSEKPKKAKKKKKKPPVAAEETSNKKGKKSIRQLKKEKYAQRQADAQAVAKDQLKSQCLNYLSQWKHDKQNWKFMKAKQVWLYKNKFSTQLVPEANWPVFLEYFESATGNIKKMLLDDAHKIIKQMDEWTESHQNEDAEDKEEETTSVTKPDENIYNRARSLIQCLQE
ncbi:uncharacterized protein C7orf50 homolog [Vanessa tameamea]|uniref:Uncharacterized protein C7orf50 homolog n=1 Tax=Vanessa tameamea TaxID=334116 RepID=A0A8B8HQH3_VANTA|nr:uncharacterized protein C7orf50 homolog [Vanessa tameamea]